jgi:hypothetical protein
MIRFLASFAIFTLAGSAAAGAEIDAAKYGWIKDYGAGKAEAKRTGKPMMLVFRCEP